MTDQPSTQKQASPYEIRYFFSAKTDLAVALRAALATDLTEPARAALEDDIVFYFNELIAIEMHTDGAALRRACAAVIDGHGFDRSRLPNVEGIEL